MHIRNKSAVYLLTFWVALSLPWIPFSRTWAGSDQPSGGKPLLTIDADKQFEFAEHYFSSREYSMAIAEYQRFIYFFPGDGRVEQAMFRIGMAHFASSHFKEAVGAFQKLIDQYGRTDLAVKSYLMISESHMRLNATGQAVINLHNLIALAADQNVKDEANYRIGWIYIETGAWEKAGGYFDRISPQNRDKYRLARLDADLGRADSIPSKNPNTAGFLSLIPGAGFLYCERYQDALITFLLNGGLMAAAYESFENDNEALGGVIAFVEFGFYAGNIYGAVASAHKYNRSKTAGFIEKLKKDHKLKLSAGIQNKGACLAFKLEF